MCEGPDVIELLPHKKYFVCPRCSVTYSKNRHGITFFIDEEVFIEKYDSRVSGRIFIIKGIYIMEECESGRMHYLIDKETSRPLKSVLDTNWLIKK